MTKWAITADLQFNTQPRYSVLLPDGITSRLNDTVEAFLWVAETAQAHGCEGMLSLGDIFDSRTSIDVSVLDKTCRAFESAALLLEQHVLVGNHDSYLRTPALNSLQALRGHATVHEKIEAHGPFVFVPWTDDPERYAASIKRAEKLDGDVMVTHAMFEGAVPKAIGKGLPLKLLTDRWDAVFLGDVHDPVCLGEESPLIQYVGAPLQINFGDADGERGFWIYDDATGDVEFVENDKSPRFHVLTDLDFDDEIFVTDRDFVRLKVDEPEVLEALREAVGKRTTWVEAEALPDFYVKPRLDVRASMTDEDLIRRYCKHLDMQSELLVEDGLEILKEARGL